MHTVHNEVRSGVIWITTKIGKGNDFQTRSYLKTEICTKRQKMYNRIKKQQRIPTYQ